MGNADAGYLVHCESRVPVKPHHVIGLEFLLRERLDDVSMRVDKTVEAV